MSQELIIKDTGVIARAELDVQISTAKAYPRDSRGSIEYAIELATMDEETAQSCFYVLPRKEKDGTKKEIKGASIRLAEIVANAWGNIHAATRIVENDGRHITAEGVAWDLQRTSRLQCKTKCLSVLARKMEKEDIQLTLICKQCYRMLQVRKLYGTLFLKLFQKLSSTEFLRKQ